MVLEAFFGCNILYANKNSFIKGRSYFYWWGWLDLNQRPKDYESSALTTELHPRVLPNYFVKFCESSRKTLVKTKQLTGEIITDRAR